MELLNPINPPKEIGNNVNKDSNLTVTNSAFPTTLKTLLQQQGLQCPSKNYIHVSSSTTSIRTVQNQQTSFSLAENNQCSTTSSTTVSSNNKIPITSHIQNNDKNLNNRTLLDSKTGHTILTNSTTHSPIASVKIHSSNSFCYPKHLNQNQTSIGQNVSPKYLT